MSAGRAVWGIEMKEYLIMCRSVTSAQRCVRLLESSLIRAYVRKAPHGLSARACGYCAVINGKLGEALELLKRKGVSHGKVYALGEGGVYEEVRS